MEVAGALGSPAPAARVGASPAGGGGGGRGKARRTGSLLRPPPPPSPASVLLCQEVPQRPVVSAAGSQLHAAVDSGDVAGVRRAVDAGADLLEQDEEMGWTALHRAVQIDEESTRVAMVSALLAMGASVEADDYYSMTPLHLAAEVGCTECARMMQYRCVVRDFNSGHQLLLPPANWCPTFASRTTQDTQPPGLCRVPRSPPGQLRSPSCATRAMGAQAALGRPSVGGEHTLHPTARPSPFRRRRCRCRCRFFCCCCCCRRRCCCYRS